VRRLAVALMIYQVTLPALAAKKTDILVLINGDHITGEIDEMDYGELRFKTDDVGTLYVKWDKVVSLTTTQVLQVELADGRRFFGQAPEVASTKGSLRVLASTEGEAPTPIELAMSDIVRVAATKVGRPLYKRLEGSIAAGYSYTRANSAGAANLSANVGARDRIRRWEVSFDGQVNSQSNAPTSQRAALAFTLERFMANRYYYESALQFTRNEELGLDLRSLIGATFGRYLVQQVGREWRAGAGLAASTETDTGGNRRDSLEAQFTTSLRLFRLDFPKMNVTADLTVLPSLSDWGRLRGEAAIKARQEFLRDLFFELAVHDSYDNMPAEGAKSNDWSLTTSFGYSF
jgi:hypothetical protein